MPSTYSTHLLLELMADGENEGLWGDITNTNLEILGRAISGSTNVTLADTSHTLTVSQAALSEGHYSVLVLGGAPTGTNTITINPNTVPRIYLVKNDSGQDAVFTQGSGGDATVVNGDIGILFSDGGGASASVTDLTPGLMRNSENLSGLADAATALQNLGVTATAAELNALDGLAATTAELNTLDGITATTAELNTLDGFTGDTDDLNYAKDLRATGVTTTEFDKLDGLTATAADLNTLDGVTASTADLNKTTGIEAGADVTDAGNVNPLVDAHLNQSTATADQVLTWDGSDYAWEDSSGGFTPTTVSGASQALDLGSFNFFDAGTLTADTTISFSNVPTEARWSYTFIGDLLTDYDIENASYDSVSFDVSSQDGGPTGIFFKPDGLKMYMVGQISDSVYQYSLSTAWDLSTASYDSVSFSVASQDSGPSGIFFKPDGTKMFMVGFGTDSAYQYSLLSAWDLSTASYDSVSFSVASQDSSPRSIFFKPDGLKMYMVGNSSDSVYQYSLSSAWDLSTASYDSVSFDVSSQDGGPTGIFFKDDGTKMFMVGSGTNSVYQYSLSTAWDLSTASYDSVSFSVASQDGFPSGIFFKPDGTKMYITGGVSESVYQYSTGSFATITLPASVQNPPTETFTTDRVTYTFFTEDGGTNVHLISEEIE